jgi:F-type H+-transporting ATPase subunit b
MCYKVLAFSRPCGSGIRAWLLAAIFCSVAALPFATSSANAQGDQKATTEAHTATAAESTPAAEESAPNPLEFKTDLALWTFVIFIVLFLVLKKFAWKPISESLDRRERHIAENIAAAQRAQDDAKKMLADYERKLAGAADEVRAMLEEARRDAEGTKQQIVAEAKSAAHAEHERAMREIRTATDAAVEELSQRSADLAVALAGKIVSSKLTGEERSRLVQESLSKFVASAPSRN